MMRKLLHSLLAGALVIATTAPAFAEPQRGHDRGWDRGERREFRDDRREFRNDRREFRNDRRDFRNDRRDFRPERRDFRNDRRDFRNDRRGVFDQRRAYRDGYRDGARHERRNDWRQGRYYHAPRWRRGDYIPRHTRYVVVHDYHRYRLPPPRRGHHYIESDGEILLIAAATGLIVWALTN